MKRVTGIGGVFFKCDDKAAQLEWYRERLGIDSLPWGGNIFLWRPDDAPEQRAYTVWSPFEASTSYFDPSKQPFMVNYRVADLDALLIALRAEGVEIVGEPMTEANGKFAWILDPEGNKIELWEPVEVDPFLEGM
jgi:catechol 2,3-dioxygenase-like lactoylglutathione lyase family enzyme